MDAIFEVIGYFFKGGLVMWPLLFCSITVIAIAIERFLFYKAIDSGSKFAQSYCALLADSNLEAATELAQQSEGAAAKILAAAAAFTGERCQAYMESQSGIIIAQLRNKLDYLGVIVTMAPLLGLLGTIIGMIGAFSIFNVEAGAPLAITGGIGEALIATATGLCVAIMSLIVHSYYGHRLNNIITDMEQCFSALLEAKSASRGDAV